MGKKDAQSFIIEDINKIREFLLTSNKEMYEYVCNSASKFVLFYKYLTHSDIATFGKATKPNSHEKNFLYYIKTEDMINVEKQTEVRFQTAHQSNIGLKQAFYDKVGLPNPRLVSPYLVNEYLNVFLVNSSVEYFKTEYTLGIFKKMERIPKENKSWAYDSIDIKLNNGMFTPIELSCAVHGIGTDKDTEFHKLRHHLFKSDTIILLAEQTTSSKNNLFILVEKNPAFFSTLGIINRNYQTYLDTINKNRRLLATTKDNAISSEKIDGENEITRAQQSVWRNMLAKEMMSYTLQDSQIFCPFTYITVNFENLGSLFTASHIKGFKDESITNEEKYDINNGLLLCANADALFDKHLITVDKNKELVFSFLLNNDYQLKSKLLLLQPIFQPILNEKRMEYLAYHHKIFEKLEIERKNQ